MKKSVVILSAVILSLAGCDNAAGPTAGNVLAKQDTMTYHFLLSGKLIYNKSYWDRTGGVTATIDVRCLKDSSQGQTISFLNSSLSDVAVSRDGGTVAYVRNDVKALAVVVAKIRIDSANQTETMVSSSAESPLRLYPNWTHDNKLAYLSYEGLQWKLKIDGHYTALDKTIAPSEISFSKDGTYFIYSVQDDSSHTSLYAYNFSKQSSHLLLKTDTLYDNCRLTAPSISSDCSAVVFIKEISNASDAGDQGETETEIWIVNIDGTNPRMVRKGSNFNPVWSPDDAYIAYFSEESIYVMDKVTYHAMKLNNSNYADFVWCN